MITDEIFEQAIHDKLQCGWTTQAFLDQQGAIGLNVYLWRVPSTGRCTLVEKVADHPTVVGGVLYRELRQ